MSSLLVFAAVIGYGIIHSLLASLQAKALAQHWLGIWAQRFYRLGFNAFAILSLLPVLALPALLPDQTLYHIPFPLSLLTITIQALSAIALAIGVLQTGALSFLGLRQVFEPQAQDGALVVTGLYRYVRHPLYTAGLVFIWLVPIMTINLLAFNLGITLYIIVGALVEERKLIHAYGETYLRYRQETPMLLPGLRPRTVREENLVN